MTVDNCDRIHELNDMNSLIEDEFDKKIAALTDAKIKSFQNEDEKLFEINNLWF